MFGRADTHVPCLCNSSYSVWVVNLGVLLLAHFVQRKTRIQFRMTSLEPPGSETPNQRHVPIKLTTRHPDITISDPGPHFVPTAFRRYGLSEIVNHLLGLESATRIPFDFLIDGAFLKTSLDEYLTANGLSAEVTLTLEYMRSVLPPVFKACYKNDDWVADVATISGRADGEAKGGEFLKKGEARVLAAGYDGIARIWDVTGTGEVNGVAAGHAGPVKCGGWIAQKRFLTAGMDRVVKLWGYDEPTQGDEEEMPDADKEGRMKGVVTPLAEFCSHKGMINSIAIHSATSQFLTASADGTVALWSTHPSKCPPASQETSMPRHLKKRKIAPTSTANVPRLAPLLVLAQSSGNPANSNPQPSSAVIFHPHDPTVSYSTTWSHQILTHDLTTSSLVSSLTTPHPILSLTALPSLSLLAAGSSARHITLHDPRADATTVSQATLRGHTNAVVSLCAAPTSEFLLASASHDGTCRVWDVRAVGAGNTGGNVLAAGEGKAQGSLYLIKRESGEGGKVFCVDWNKEVGIVSGGEDRRVQVNTGVEVGGRGGEVKGVFGGGVGNS